MEVGNLLTATIEKIKTVEQAEQLGQMILESDVAQKYQSCYFRLYTNLETKGKINRFSRLKEQYEEVQRFGRYHPDYSRVMKEVREAKREMDLDDNVAAFRVAEKELQTLLDEISVLIGHAVSKGIKVPSGNPFFSLGSSCGGSCGTGGGCGCSA
ncbi:YlbF family regulator [Bacillus aerolatus]|uniref:YlbF family regulator n=1 Tax=Bacillus aerolatus TaxID=2653354 RepID=A0A6I1FXP9_9BACI|nr:YlbF family regulator [Bacillus aerolatus]KAB7707948.1 YlbF family regulator [Bacillus aerolatus]